MNEFGTDEEDMLLIGKSNLRCLAGHVLRRLDLSYMGPARVAQW